MRPSLVRRAPLAALLLLAALLPGRVVPEDVITLQVGAMPIDPSAQVFYAEREGFFTAAGLDVHLTVLNNGAAILAATAAGNLDIGFGSPAPVIQARQRGIPVRFIAPAAVYSGPPANSVLMVASDSPIHSAADLDGKTVAVSGLRDLTYFSTQAWLAENGGNAGTIRFVELPYAEMAAAIASGRIAAGCLIEPFITSAKASARVLGNLNAAVGNPYLLAGWFATDSWIARNPEAAKRFVAVMERTARWANAHQKESAAILAAYANASPEVTAAMTRSRYDARPGVSPQLVEPVIDLLQKYANMTSLPPASELVR